VIESPNLELVTGIIQRPKGKPSIHATLVDTAEKVIYLDVHDLLTEDSEASRALVLKALLHKTEGMMVQRLQHYRPEK
jgi:hypothetical protein